MFFSKVMEGLDFITLYVALSQGQVDSILGGGVAMPQESSQRFGLRVSKEEAVQRSHDFAEWERLYVARGGEVLTHKDFIICTIRVYAIGYLQKSIGEVLVRTKQAVKTLIAHYPKQEKTNKKISRPFKNFPLTVCCLRKFDRRILPQPFRNLCAALILAVVMTSHLFQKLDSEILSLNSQVVR